MGRGVRGRGRAVGVSWEGKGEKRWEGRVRCMLAGTAMLLT